VLLIHGQGGSQCRLVEEFEHWLKIAVGLTPTPLRPFVGSITGAMPLMNPDLSASMLRTPTMHAHLLKMRETGWEAYFPKAAVEVTARIRGQAELRASMTREQVAQRIADERAAALGVNAEAAHERLQQKTRDADYIAKRLKPADARRALADCFRLDPRSLPNERLERAFNDAFFRNAETRQPNSKKEREQLPGAVADRMHAAVGGVYCDVFTCDGESAKWIAPVRAALGLKPPIVLAGHPGGPAGFVADLVATWPIS
jgi:hypothetical protein